MNQECVLKSKLHYRGQCDFQIPCEDSQKYIKEAADILRDDVSAPKIIQDLWND